MKSTGVSNIGFIGSFISFCLSLTVNKSIWWAILQFFTSWVYVLYWIFKYSVVCDYIIKYFVKGAI